jgi:hypothetical protein
MSSVTLMILGEALDPGEVTKLLGLRPSRHWCRGDQKSFSRSGSSVLLFDTRHDWSGWKKWSSATERKKEFVPLVEHWCRKLTPKKKTLGRLRRSGAEVFLDCFLVGETSEFALPPALLAKLADLHLTLRVAFSHHQEEPDRA